MFARSQGRQLLLETGEQASLRSMATRLLTKPRKAAVGQKEMLMPISGKNPAKEAGAKKPAAKQQRKSA